MFSDSCARKSEKSTENKKREGDLSFGNIDQESLEQELQNSDSMDMSFPDLLKH
jgi:hypothetical protein